MAHAGDFGSSPLTMPRSHSSAALQCDTFENGHRYIPKIDPPTNPRTEKTVKEYGGRGGRESQSIVFTNKAIAAESEATGETVW